MRFIIWLVFLADITRAVIGQEQLSARALFSLMPTCGLWSIQISYFFFTTVLLAMHVINNLRTVLLLLLCIRSAHLEMLTNTGIFLRGSKLCGESRT